MTAVREPVTGAYVHIPYAGYEYRVFYEEAGEGIPLVCLHTAGTDSREWRHQLNDPDINEKFRVIALDLPRHGKSIPPIGFEKEDYRLTAKFYSEFVMAFCEALELDRPVIMGSSMGGNICLHLALNFEERVRALIAIEACEYSPGWYISWLAHPHVHGGEACATSVFGLMAPQSPDEYRWETWWYYSQGGPGVFKGDLYFYSVDHDFRGLCEKISGNVPIYLMTGVYDFACTPEMTAETGKKIKGSETIIMEDIGHFPMCENPETFKKYLMPVLEKIEAGARQPVGAGLDRRENGGPSFTSRRRRGARLRPGSRPAGGGAPERGRGSALEHRDALIGGRSVEMPEAFDDVDPSSGRLIAHVARCGDTDVDQAIRSARQTFEESWRRTTAAERARVLGRTAELVRRERDSLAELESMDTGKPLRQASADAEVAARYFEFYADSVEGVYGDTIPVADDLLVYTLREPYGVTGHIVPWNYPLQIGARTVAPALAAGNCCVLKPAEEAPLTTLRLGELVLEAGFPAGALNVVPGYGEEAGAALAGHPGIDHLAFTGSVEVGRSVAKAAGENTVPVTLELGGKSPNVVLADADLDAAAPTIVNSIIQNAGQTCSAGSRLLVEASVHDALVEGVADRFRAIKIGPGPEDPALGPLISAQQRDGVQLHVEQGKSEARLVVGGDVARGDHLDGGFFYLPTLFDEVPRDAEIAQDEIFGPVLAVTPFRDLEHAVELANATRYGLIAAVWTSDLRTAHHLAREIRAGQVYINTYGAGGGVELPFGGVKHSGYGREKGFEALIAYTRTKTVAVKVAGA